MGLEAPVRYSGDVAILDLAGRIVLNDGSATLRQTLADLRETGVNKILLNMAGITFVDSSGLGELASAFAAMSRSGGQLKLVNLTGRILDLLRVTKLDSVLTSYPSEPAAIESFNGGATTPPAET